MLSDEWRPDWGEVVGWVVGQVGQAGAVGIHHIYLSVPVPLGGEGDVPAVGRPVWMEVVVQAVGQVGQISPKSEVRTSLLRRTDLNESFPRAGH